MHKQFIRKILEPNPNLAKAGEDWLREVHSRFRRIIGVHIRRGDYVELSGEDAGQFSRVPTAIYRHWLGAQLRDGDGVFISTDDEGEIYNFDNLPVLNKIFPRDNAISGEEGDFYLLGRCDVAAYCNSSWSLMCALLAIPGQQAYVIDFKKSKFVSFDPWNETWFWQRFLPFRGGVPADWHDSNIAQLARLAELRHALEIKLADREAKLAEREARLSDTETQLVAMKRWGSEIEPILVAPVGHLADLLFSRLASRDSLMSITSALPFGRQTLQSFFYRARSNYERYKKLMKAPMQ
jgi:hypothetical protein